MLKEQALRFHVEQLALLEDIVLCVHYHRIALPYWSIAVTSFTFFNKTLLTLPTLSFSELISVRYQLSTYSVAPKRQNQTVLLLFVVNGIEYTVTYMLGDQMDVVFTTTTVAFLHEPTKEERTRTTKG